MLASRRQFKRYDINLATKMTVDGDSFVSCQIRDACVGGLFITFQQYKGIKALSVQQQILVHFSINLDHDDKDFKLQVKIVHIDSNGFGIAFEGDSDIFFNILTKEAQKKVAPPNTDKLRRLTSLSEQKKLEADFTSLSKEVLPIIIRNFFNHTEKNIQQAADEAEDYHTRVTLLDTFTNLKVNKKQLTNDFCKFSDPVTLLIPSLITGLPSNTSPEAQLTLVKKNDFEDWLNLLPIIRNLETHFESRLNSIQEKISLVFEVDTNEVINPFNPALLCENFRDNLGIIEKNEQGKSWLYSIYGKILTDILPHIYKKIDAIFLKYKIQEKAKELKEKKRINSKSRQAIRDQFDYQNYLAYKRNTQKNLSSTPIQNTKKTKNSFDIVSNLMHLVQEASSHKDNHNNEDGLDEYSTKEKYSALSFLQQKATKNKSLFQNDRNRLLDELQQTLNRFSTEQKKLSTTDKNNIDIYDSLFKTLINENLLSHDTQTYLQQLYIPIITQAILNPSLLESGTYPVQEIINHLSKLETTIKNNTKIKNTHIKQLLDQQIKKISTESINNPVIFSSVENNLSELTQSVDKYIDLNLKRVQDIYNGKQKLKETRDFVQNEINQNLGGKKIPKIILTLLETGWQHLLVIAKLNKDNRNYQTHLRTINDLSDWLTGRKKVSKKLAITTLEFIDNELKPVNANRLLHCDIQNELRDLLLGNKIKLNSDAMEMASFEIQKIDSVNISKQNNEVCHLKTGEWLTFFLGKELEPLKLAWINHTHNVFVFVNRDGIKKLELDAVDLNEMIRKGKATLTDSLDTPVMDRATYMMLQKLHEKLIFNATHDSTTHLLNQKEFITQVKRELTKPGHDKYLLCNIEIQDFRTITNACGVSGVEALLKQLATLLKQHVNKDDLSARLNDRAFSVLLKNCSAEVAKELHTNFISSEFKWQDKNYAVATSMGIVPLFSKNKYEINSLLQNVDSANLSALNAGRNCVRVYKDDDESLKSQFDAREWVGRINQVLTENRLFLRCQKIVPVNPGMDSKSHYEILLGIKDEKGKIIAPNDFIPAVECCQRMSEVDRWVVLSVFDWIKCNPNIFKMLGGFSINLSGESINSGEFLEFLKQTLSSHNDVPLEKIIFEITETVAADNFQFIQTFIKKIKRFKCKFSLDDFGSGYSSFSYLKSLEVDYLKIDGIFVKDIVNNSTDIAIVSSMNEIAHFLKLKTTAEYVENSEAHMLLKKIGVDYVQGWGIEKPKLLSDLGE